MSLPEGSSGNISGSSVSSGKLLSVSEMDEIAAVKIDGCMSLIKEDCPHIVSPGLEAKLGVENV
jgi:hypothetical protein